MKTLLSNVRAFAADESGVALSEYLILLGLLVGGVLAAVSFAGNNLAASWNDWGNFFTVLGDKAPQA